MGPKLIPIFAAQGGKVTRIGTGSLSGLRLRHRRRRRAQLQLRPPQQRQPRHRRRRRPLEQAVAPGVEVGARSYVASTSPGWATPATRRDRPHLHFSITDPTITDPYGSHQRNPYPSLRAALRPGRRVDLDVARRSAPPRRRPRRPGPDLGRLCGQHAPPESFTDVAAASVHAGPIGCLAATQRALGFGDGRYGPGGPSPACRWRRSSPACSRPAGSRCRSRSARRLRRRRRHRARARRQPAGRPACHPHGTPARSGAPSRAHRHEARPDGGVDGTGLRAHRRARLPATARTTSGTTPQYHHADINRLAAAGIVQGDRAGRVLPRTACAGTRWRRTWHEPSPLRPHADPA